MLESCVSDCSPLEEDDGDEEEEGAARGGEAGNPGGDEPNKAEYPGLRRVVPEGGCGSNAPWCLVFNI